MKLLSLLFFCCTYTPAFAVELFGVDLNGTTRDELRLAIENAGVKLVQYAGKGTFYDVYKGDTVLHKANQLYLGFVKKDKKFAFAEYEFSGFKHPVLLNKLNKKYGKASPIKGKFISDQSYSWVSKGIQITFYQDWNSYKTRLTYFNPETLKQLRNEQKLFSGVLKKQMAIYLEQGY
ncbi:MAG: hypothetical protein GY744_08740 [Gammaproteobacteria bacterium]|nr:hypothetical protein [Gammaproteobacteria bacterium]